MASESCGEISPASDLTLRATSQAKYGVMMLEKLVLQYCPKDGSSTGMR